MPINNDDKWSRPLVFPLKDSLVPDATEEADGTITNLTIDFFPNDPDERIDIVLNLSANEFTTIASAIDIGRDIGYGNQSALVWWIWCRSQIGALQLSCEQIIDCIETNPSTGAALQQWMSTNGYGNGVGTPDNPSVYTANPTVITAGTAENCDYDALFGAIKQLIQYIDRALTDLFEIIESTSNGFERAAIIGEGVPISDELGVDTVANSFDQALEEVAENYAANFTIALENEYSCALFCLVQDTCVLDFQSFADYFMDRVGTIISIESFEDSIEWFLVGSFSGSQIPDAAFAIAMTALAYGSSIAQLDMSTISAGMLAALDEPDSTWDILCPDCGTPDLCDSYLNSNGNIVVVGGNGSRIQDKGWTSSDFGATVRLTLERNYGSAQNIDTVIMTLTSENFSYGSVVTQLRIYNPDTATVIHNFDIAALVGTNNGLQLVHNSPFTASRFWIQFDVTGNANGSVSLEELCVDPQGA
jgi:hypothetical protein